MTALTAVVIPTVAVMVGRVAAPRTPGWQFVVLLALVLPLVGATLLLTHWAIKATLPIPPLAAISVFLVALLSMLGHEYRILSSRGEEVDAVVISKSQYTSPGNEGFKFHCVLREVEGGEIDPDVRSRDCKRLGEGDEIRLLVDPEGEITPVLVDGPILSDSTVVRVAWPSTIVLAAAMGVSILIGGVRNRYRLPPPPSG